MGQTIIFRGVERKKEEKKRKAHQQQTEPLSDTHVIQIEREHNTTSNDIANKHFWMSLCTTCNTRRVQELPMHHQVRHTNTSFFVFCFPIQLNTKVSLSCFYNYKTKIIVKRPRSPLTPSFIFFILRVFLVFIFCLIPNYLLI